MVRGRWISCCLGNHVSLPVPATTSGGPGGDTGEGVSLSRALRESGTKICVKRSCFVIVQLLWKDTYMVNMDVRKWT